MRETVSVLLVEDKPAHVRLTKEKLADAGLVADIEVARDGEEALVLLGVDPHEPEAAFTPKKPYDFIVIDLNLPILDGRDLIDIIRQNIYLSRTPLIIMTSSLDDRGLILEHRLPTAAYIEKPIDKRSLIAALEAYPALTRISHMLDRSGGDRQ